MVIYGEMGDIWGMVKGVCVVISDGKVIWEGGRGENGVKGAKMGSKRGQKGVKKGPFWGSKMTVFWAIFWVTPNFERSLSRSGEKSGFGENIFPLFLTLFLAILGILSFLRFLKKWGFGDQNWSFLWNPSVYIEVDGPRFWGPSILEERPQKWRFWKNVILGVLKKRHFCHFWHFCVIFPTWLVVSKNGPFLVVSGVPQNDPFLAHFWPIFGVILDPYFEHICGGIASFRYRYGVMLDRYGVRCGV